MVEEIPTIDVIQLCSSKEKDKSVHASEGHQRRQKIHQLPLPNKLMALLLKSTS
jgi:hypothetical protein